MSGLVAIIIIAVVWLVVLAPLSLRGQKPIRRTNEAFEQTRVVVDGAQGILPERPRPRFFSKDIHSSRTESDASAAIDVAAEDILIEDASTASSTSVKSAEQSTVASQNPAIIDGDVVETDTSADTSQISEEDSAADSAPAESLEFYEITPVDLEEDVEQDFYDYPEHYVGPADLLDPRAEEYAENSLEHVEGEQTGSADSADTEAEGSEPELDQEYLPTQEDQDFVAARRGRGWYDPEADRLRAQDRYQRRQRTLIVLAAVIAIGLIISMGFGGWFWSIPAMATAITVLYLVELRRQVRIEQALRARRLRHLRRARLGVRSTQSEELGIPQRLRHPGAIVLELDDESPDFEYLETRMSAEDYSNDEGFAHYARNTDSEEYGYQAAASSRYEGNWGGWDYEPSRRVG